MAVVLYQLFATGSCSAPLCAILGGKIKKELQQSATPYSPEKLYTLPATGLTKFYTVNHNTIHGFSRPVQDFSAKIKPK